MIVSFAYNLWFETRDERSMTDSPPAPSVPRMNTKSLCAAVISGTAYLALAGLLAFSPPYEHQYTTVNYASDAAFLIALLASIPAMLAFASSLDRQLPGVLYSCGAALLSGGVLAELAAGHALSWFVVVGVTGNLLGMIGTIWLAVVARRERAVPVALITLLVLYVPIGVGVAGIGGSIVPAMFWLALSLQLVRRPSLLAQRP